MSVHIYPSVAVRHFGRVYDFDLKGVRTSARTHVEVAETLSRLGGEFDCFLVNRRSGAVSDLQPVIAAIARHVGVWVEVFGIEAEAIHDAIDQASVDIGRQEAAGDGDPMTAWDSVTNDAGLAQYIATGGQGECPQRVIVYFAEGRDEELFFEHLKGHLASRDSS